MSFLLCSTYSSNPPRKLILTLLSDKVRHVFSSWSSPSLPVLNRCYKCCCRVLSYRPHMTALTNVSTLRLFCRLSALSLSNMCPCPILDAEAHGKDNNNCPEQLYLSNGDVSPSFSFLSHFVRMRVQAHFVAPAFSRVRLLLQWLGGWPAVCLHNPKSAAAVCDLL